MFQQLHDKIVAISTFIEDENRLLRNRQEEQVIDSFHKKEILMTSYQKSFQRFIKDKGIDALSLGQRNTLKEKLKRLNDLGEENMILVKDIIHGYETYMKMLGEVVKRQHKANVYSMKRPQKNNPEQAPALSVCKNL